MPSNDNDAWRIFPRQLPDGPIAVRCHAGWRKVERGAFPHCISIVWTHGPRSEEPTVDERAELDEFEQALRDPADLRDQAFLSVVVSGCGHSEFVFHVRSADEFVRHLEALPEHDSAHRIRVSHFYDPDWNYVQKLLVHFNVTP